MNRLPFYFLFFALLLCPVVAQGVDYEVDASSHNWMSARGYGVDNLVDNDPSTAWSEGGTGVGEGEWVSFSFVEPIKLAHLEIRNGDQRAESWETCNRVNELKIELSTGHSQIVSLDNKTGSQLVSFPVQNVSKITLTIVSAYLAESIWNRSVTCLSDVLIGVYGPGEMPTQNPVATPSPLPARPQPELVKVVLPESQPAPAPQVEPLPQREAPELKRVVLPQPAPPEPKAEPVVVTRVPAPVLKKVVLPMTDPAGEAVELVRQYYLRLNTLDETFPDLMASKVYEQELFSFLYFQEIQKQLGTDQQLREAQLDLSSLTIELDPEKLTEATAKVFAQGSYTIATPGQKLILDENALFSLLMEQGQWKILKKVDQD